MSHTEHHKNSFSILVGHAHISQGIQNEKTKWLALPSWMMSYNRSLSKKWSIGIHTDIIIEDFVVQDLSRNAEEGAIIERSYPISLVAATTFKPIHQLGIIAGVGIEYAEEETFTLVRLGLEPNIKINSKYEVIFNLSYDLKFNAYDNWNLGVGIVRIF
ncbi:hypothetical protein [Nonlabens dokdonensis]|uniref:hypothetical protein n=1 Tax=Nonlabens dokdonensis TaxID=328515 RepID=UPI0011B83484|nr:hypothetical protein [Nonlabens dokdonensis]